MTGPDEAQAGGENLGLGLGCGLGAGSAGQQRVAGPLRRPGPRADARAGRRAEQAPPRRCGPPREHHALGRARTSERYWAAGRFRC
jgi:hypothetical protein